MNRSIEIATFGLLLIIRAQLVGAGAALAAQRALWPTDAAEPTIE